MVKQTGRIFLLLAMPLLLVASFTTLIFSSTAKADYTVNQGETCADGKTQPARTVSGSTTTYTCSGDKPQTSQTAVVGGSGQDQKAADDDGETCAIEKIGWILCPVIEQSGKIGDQAFQYLSKTFLETEPELVSSTEGVGTKYAWDIARGLANIMFIIAFLIIIYSQVTGAGIGNYGIKKMLPRLIVAAIAVNASYWICQLLVDITNIMGYEIQNFLMETSRSITQNSAMPISSGDGPSVQSGGTLTSIALLVLGASAIVYFMLPVLGSVILFIVVTCVSIVAILLLRKAFIVLLIVAAPIAFVMYLLPNTEKYFQKWLSMFWKLLLVFPIVGMLMGGGQLASSIILVAGASSGAYKSPNNDKCITLPTQSSSQSQGSNTGWFSFMNNNADKKAANNAAPTASTGTCVEGSVPPMLGLVAAGIAVLPLIAVWAVLKGALSAAGAIGGKISGAVEKGVNRGVNGAGNAGKKKWEQSAFGRGQALRKQAKQDYKNEKFLKGLGDPNEAKSEWEKRRRQYTRLASGGLAGVAPGGVLGSLDAQKDKLARAAASGEALAQKRLQEDVQAEGIKAADLGNAELRAVIDSGNVNDPKVAAAINELGKRQDFEGIEKALAKIQANPGASLASHTLATTMSQNNSGLMTAGQIGDISRGAHATSYAETVRGNIENGILSPEKMAESGPSVLDEASRLATSIDAKNALIRSASTVASDPLLSKKIGRNAGQINNLKAGKDAKTGASW